MDPNKKFHALLEAVMPLKNIERFDALAYLLAKAKSKTGLKLDFYALHLKVQKKGKVRKSPIGRLVERLFEDLDAGNISKYMDKAHEDCFLQVIRKIKTRVKRQGSKRTLYGFKTTYAEHVMALQKEKESKIQEIPKLITGTLPYTSPILGSSWMDDHLTPPPLEE